MRQICVLLCLLSLPLCSAHSLAAEPPAPHTRTGALDAVAPLATAGGTTLSVPGGWSVRRTGPLLILDAPEPDTHIALADVHGADAQAAAKAAWALYRPGLDRQVTLVTARAARNGWDERKALDYKIAPNERAEVQTIASRSGAAWTVLIIDATEHTWETRAAAFSLVLQSIRPKGYVPESFAGRTPNRLDPARMAAVRAFLVEAMKQAGVVGASFALLEKGAVVYEGGIGVREQGNSAAVDADTVFMAGGNTKGMSSLLLATLVDQGKLRWDQPVIEVYPAFRRRDAQATSKVLVKDLDCDCAGRPASARSCSPIRTEGATCCALSCVACWRFYTTAKRKRPTMCVLRSPRRSRKRPSGARGRPCRRTPAWQACWRKPTVVSSWATWRCVTRDAT